MTFALINLSGNVGRAALAVHLFACNAAKIISVGSVNSPTPIRFKASSKSQSEPPTFEIFRELMMAEGDVILDVGASNVTGSVAEMKKFKARRSRSLIVVPVVPRKESNSATRSPRWNGSPSGFDPKRIRSSSTSSPMMACPWSTPTARSTATSNPPATAGPPVARGRGRQQRAVRPREGSGKTIRELAEGKTDWREAQPRPAQPRSFEHGRGGGRPDEQDLAQTAQAEVWKIIGIGKK